MMSASRIAVYGYGSLIHPGSIARTLGREVPPGHLSVCRLQGFGRTWNLTDAVIDSWKRRQSAVFLNLRESADGPLIGVQFPLDEGELEVMDLRERNYRRIDVTDRVEPRVSEKLFTYIGKAEHLVAGKGSVVMDRYENIIEEGLRYWGEDFREEFSRSTPAHGFPTVEGEYRFATVG